MCRSAAGPIKSSTYYVASMAAFGLIGACYTNIAISLVFTREAGILKRTRGTPAARDGRTSARGSSTPPSSGSC